jgi:transcriptional regulator with XRE-family HTH domain
VSPRSRERDFAQPELGQALAWLRARQYLTQKEVAAQARRHEELSDIYYQLIEGGKRLPSKTKLDAVLSALDSDRSELEGLVAARVWEGTSRGSYRIRSARPRPEAYLRAAEETLAEGAQNGGWSSPITGPMDSTSTFAGLADGGSPTPNLSVDLKRRSASISSPPYQGNEPDPADPVLRGQLAELSDHFLRLPPPKRLELLERARKLRKR